MLRNTGKDDVVTEFDQLADVPRNRTSPRCKPSSTGRAEHRVAVEERFGQPGADGAFAPGWCRAEPVEALVGDDLGQPCFRHRDPPPVSGLPTQERFRNGVLGVGGGAQRPVGQRGQPDAAGSNRLVSRTTPGNYAIAF